MNNEESVNLQGVLTFPEESLEKIKLLYRTWVYDTQVTATLKKDQGEEICIQVFVDHVSKHAADEEFNGIGDIFLKHILYEKEGLLVLGYVKDEKEGKKFPIEILYTALNGFGVYRIDPESDYEPPEYFTQHPSLN